LPKFARPFRWPSLSLCFGPDWICPYSCRASWLYPFVYGCPWDIADRDQTMPQNWLLCEYRKFGFNRLSNVQIPSTKNSAIGTISSSRVNLSSVILVIMRHAII
jgi:hypothetical protein